MMGSLKMGIAGGGDGKVLRTKKGSESGEKGWQGTADPPLLGG